MSQLYVSRTCDISFKWQAVTRSILARLIPKLRGICIIIGLARSNKDTVKKVEFSGKNLIS